MLQQMHMNEQEKDLATQEKLTLASSTEDITRRILEEEDPDELKEIISVFNIHMKKKDLARVSKLSTLQDKISDQMEKRLDKRADEFSNKDLIDYMRVIQGIIDRSDTTTSSIELPAIQINQNNVNINDNSLSRESREHITDAITSIFNKLGIPKPNSESSSIIDIPLDYDNEEEELEE